MELLVEVVKSSGGLYFITADHGNEFSARTNGGPFLSSIDKVTLLNPKP
jgi:bisphosphoglycerate-independent phosphoglycerate mutase (AlkP superfamily)